MLHPYESRLVFRGTSVFGPVAKCVAALADALGDADAADAHSGVATGIVQQLRHPAGRVAATLRSAGDG